MRVKFTQFFDLSSSSEKFTKFTVSAGGTYVKQRCAPQFACYKYYKLGRVTVKLVPASTLPVDPTGLSYEAGETTVDPRDMFNPGLVRITNGEDLLAYENINDNVYYSTLLDSRWFKFQLQQGFSRSAVPLAYNIGEISQDQFPFLADVYNNYVGDPNIFAKNLPSDTDLVYKKQTLGDKSLLQPYLPIQTGKIRLGWMPTDSMNYNSVSTGGKQTNLGGSTAYVPEVPLITFILPKAYKTKFYYRAFIETTVYFKDPVAVNPIIADGGIVGTPIDRFVGMAVTRCGPDGRLGGFDKQTLTPYSGGSP